MLRIRHACNAFENQLEAGIAILAAILNLDPEDIKETRILNSYLRKIHEDDKLGILDVRVLMNNDTEIDTEIQLSELNIWADRALLRMKLIFIPVFTLLKIPATSFIQIKWNSM